MSEENPLFFIVGTTASGKSRLALEVAESLSGQIINGDSVQVYKYVNIGTAKPSLEEMKRVPHHLFDFVEPPEKMTAGKYNQLARARVNKALKTSPVLVVGGSGFYLQALEKGMYPVKETHPEVEKTYQEILHTQGSEILYEHLKKEDAEYAKKVKPKDSYRVLRALCLLKVENKSMAEIEREFLHRRELTRLPYTLKKIGLYLNRDELRVRVRQRILAMDEAGLIDEVEDLIGRGLRGWAPLASVGYKETVAYLEGRLDKTEWRQAMEVGTMQLAKRQTTWFKRDKDIHWYHSEREWDKAVKDILKRRGQ